MVDPYSISTVIGILVTSAPSWFHSLEETFLNKGKEIVIEKGEEKIRGFLDEKKHLRHVQLVLQNAAERGIKQFNTLEEHDKYRSILSILSESNSETLRLEAMQLFTLSDDPDLATLTEKYNFSQRVTALAHHKTYEEIDATIYLRSFFEALIAELYNDPLFREQMSDVLKVRAALKGQRSLEEITNILNRIDLVLANNYTSEQFQRDIDIYIDYIEKKYRYHKFAGIVFRGDEDKAPELDNIFVPLSILPQQGSLQTRNDILTLLERFPYLVLLGGPGSGKSTTTRYLAWSHAKGNLKTNEASPLTSSKKPDVIQGKPVPLCIELRLLSEARKQHAGYSFLSYTHEIVLGREDIDVHPQMFKALLERRGMFLLFDGLDEVSTLAERKQIIDEIESFAQFYPGNRILVTSRPVGYDIASFTNRLFQHGQVQDFDDEQIHQFLESWYKYVLKYIALPLDIRQELEMFYSTLKVNERLHRLATNPLLLTVMTALHRYERLPDERVLIYEKCADLLLDTWAKLKYENGRWNDMKMGKKDQLACIAHLGFVLHQRAQEVELSNTDLDEEYTQQMLEKTATDVPVSFMRREIKRFLTNQNLLSGAEQHVEAERFLELVRIEAGLIVERGTDEAGEPLYGFVHRSFQEYFAAVDVLERYQQEDDSNIVSDFLREHVHDPHWYEVILLLLGKLKHKVATVQLRRLLRGQNRLSKYTNVVKDFAEEVVLYLDKLVKEALYPKQNSDALYILGMLLKTRQYADLARQALKKIIADSKFPDISTKIEAAETVYKFSVTGSQEQREAFYLLFTYAQNNSLTLEQHIQVVEAVYKNSPWQSQEQQEAIRLLLTYAQNNSLTLKQHIQAADIVYWYSSTGSEDQREAGKLLLECVLRAELTLVHQIQMTKSMYQYSVDGAKEQQEGGKVLLALAQQHNLTIAQQIQAILAIYQYSPAGSQERQEALALLLARAQQADLTLEQQIQIAQAIFEYSYLGSQERQEVLALLLAHAQQADLTLEQQIQVAQIIYGYSPDGSQEEREGSKLLLTRAQQGGLTIEQQIQVVQAIYQYSPDGSQEQQEAVRLLLAHAQQADLTLEQQIQVVQAIYRYSPSGATKEQGVAGKLLLARAQQGDLTMEQKIQMAQAIYRYRPDRSEEKAVGGELLLALAQEGDLTIEQQIQVAQAIYGYSPFGSEKKLEAIRLLLALSRKRFLTIEQQIQLIQAIYEYSHYETQERQEALALLLAGTQQSDLTVEQQIQVTQAVKIYGYGLFKQEARRLRLTLAWQKALTLEEQIQLVEELYSNSPARSEEQQEASKLFLSLIQQKTLSLDMQIEICKRVYRNSPSSSKEQRERAKMLLALVQQEDLTIKQQIQVANSIIELIPINLFRSSDVPYIFKCATEEAMPIEVRDKMYQILRNMVPHFENMTY